MTHTGKIGVTTENIFPVIKKFLYSDHEIFLRELVANAVDASQKLKALAASCEYEGSVEDLKVRIELDEAARTLKIIDNGIGMTAEEVDKYINQIAFSSAGEFLEKYKDKIGNIIGHFGLGFYSAFMVADKVDIETLSWRAGATAVRWSCDGSPEYSLEECSKADIGTTITLHLAEDEAEFASKSRIEGLLGKYCKFMPIPVVFGYEQEWKDGKYVDTDKEKVVNSVAPLWAKKPSEITSEEYSEFYRALYPMAEEPLFHIHLNVDYPFNLTGILYFPKIKDRMEVTKNKIQLYCNQMFVTDSVEDIVPDFLTLLHGVIDSPDIPLNVSRSYLQSDAQVKKISGYITRKVADRLEEIYKNERAALEEKWDNLKLFIEYGMLSDEKFCDRALKFCLLKNTEGKYFGIEDYRAAVAGEQTNKDGKTVILYATDSDAQYAYISAAQSKGYDVLLLDCQLDSHFVGLLETKLSDVQFARVDSDSIENLILKSERIKPELSEDDQKSLSEMFKAVLPEGYEFNVVGENLGVAAAPILITQSEFMRRYREMSALGGGMNFYGSLPEAYNIVVNMESEVVAGLFKACKASDSASDSASNSETLKQLVDIALLSHGLLKGKALSDFIARSNKVVSDAYLK